MKETMQNYYDSVQNYFKKDLSPLEKGIIALIIFAVGLTLGLVLGIIIKSGGKDEHDFDEEIDVPDFDKKQIPEKATETSIPEEELFQDIPLEGNKKAFWHFKK